jgi:hypothetical protein
LRDFAAALSADPESYGLDAKKAVVTSRVQSQLRSGYGRSWAEIADHQDWESLDNLAQVGVGIQLGHSWAQFADSITQTLPHLRPDVRCVAIRRIDELLKTTMAVVRPLSDDSDATTRKRSWLLLDMMVSEIESWRRKIPGAARDDDKAVRENCFLNLAHNIDSNIISTVLDTCQNANGVALREALAALRHMVWEASSVVMLGSRALQALSRRLDDTTLSTDIREELLSILKSYAEVFQHRDVGINWAELSTRTLADETKGDAGADSPST